MQIPSLFLAACWNDDDDDKVNNDGATCAHRRSEDTSDGDAGTKRRRRSASAEVAAAADDDENNADAGDLVDVVEISSSELLVDDTSATLLLFEDAELERESPIIERELLTHEHELANIKSRLAMSESVSDIAKSVLDSIRKELERFESLCIYSRLFKIFDRIADANARLEIDQKDKTPSCQAKQLVHFGKNFTQLMCAFLLHRPFFRLFLVLLWSCVLSFFVNFTMSITLGEFVHVK